MHEIDTGIEIV